MIIYPLSFLPVNLDIYSGVTASYKDIIYIEIWRSILEGLLVVILYYPTRFPKISISSNPQLEIPEMEILKS